MTDIDKFLQTEYAVMRLDSMKAMKSAADSLREKLINEYQRIGFKPTTLNQSIKVYNFDNASYLRLDKILSSHAQKTSILGNPNLWILLPDGERLGFKRINPKNTWRDLKNKYGNRLFFSNNVVVYRHPQGRNYAIYKLEKRIDNKPRIDLEKIAKGVIDD